MVTKIEEKVYPFKNQSEGVDDDIMIELSVCDETFNVSIKENDRELYEQSAIRITKCYNSYLEHYKSRPICIRFHSGLFLKNKKSRFKATINS
jgi:hypothetical protein